MFRLARPEDVRFIAELIGEFYGKVGGVYQGIPYDQATGEAAARAVIEKGIALVGPTSCAGAIIRPFDWNRAYRVAQVAFWYFREARERVIFERLCELCQALGASHVNANSHFPGNRIGRYYGKRGMRAAEVAHFGRLGLVELVPPGEEGHAKA